VEDGEVDVFLWGQRKILFLDNVFPFLYCEQLSLAFFSDQQEPLDIHILDPFLLVDVLVVGSILEKYKILAGRFLEYLRDNNFKGSSTILRAWLLLFVLLLLRFIEDSFELFEIVHKY